MRAPTKTRRVVHLLPVLVLLAALLSSCQGAPTRSARAHSDWSRGAWIGSASLNSPVAMVAGRGDEDARFLWVAEDDQDRQVLRFAHVDASGALVSERQLAVDALRPNQPALARDASGRLHATWLARDGEIYRLYHALLDDAGEVSAGPEVVSPDGAAVQSYACFPSSEAGIEVFWGAIEGAAPGMYHARLTEPGAASDSRPLGFVGFDPAAARARDGTLHLVWKQIPETGRQSVHYGVFDVGARAVSSAGELVSFGVPTGLVSHRPSLGIAQGRAYVFWSLERRGGGLSKPSAESRYVSFPLGHPEEAGRGETVAIPDPNHPEYHAIHSPFHLTEAAENPEGLLPSQFVYQPSAVSEEQDQLATAFAVQIVGRTKSVVQIVLALWADGRMVGYQIAGQSDSISLRPSLAADGGGDLHLNWIDTAGFGRYSVYYAATTAEARANLNRLGFDDVTAAVFGVLWGIAQAASFFPIVLVWLIAPLTVLAVYCFIRAEDGLDRVGSRVMLVVGALIYMLIKYLFRPTWLAALPLPRGTPLPVANALMYVAPLLILGLAALIAWLVMRRRQYPSLLPAFGVLAGSDALLTLLVYVPGILAE